MRQKLALHPSIWLCLKLWLVEIVILIVFILTISHHLIWKVWNNLMLFNALLIVCLFFLLSFLILFSIAQILFCW